METIGDKTLLKIGFKYYCNTCDYGTSKKSSYLDHTLSSKHKKRTTLGDNKTDLPPSSANKLVCEKCNKQYLSRNGLWSHKKKCIDIPAIASAENVTDKDLMLILIKQNKQLIEQNAELVKNRIHPHNEPTSSFTYL